MKIKDLCSYAPKSKIKAGEAVENAKYIFFTSSADENKRYTDFQFDKEAIIMGTGGNATLHYYNGKFSVSTDCLVLFPNSKIKCKYLYYFFKSHMSVLEAGFKGAGLKHTNKKYIEEINVSEVPNLTTQEKIIFHLDTISGNIEKLNRELELFDSLTKARFIEMFGDPVLNERKFPTLSGADFFKLSNGRAVPDEKRIEAGIPAYGGNGISWYTDEFLMAEDTIVVGRVGFQSGNVHYVIGPLWITDNAMYISQYDKDKFNLRFLYELMQHVNFSRFQDAGDLKKITQKPFMTFKYILPSMDLQQKFVNFKIEVDKSKLAVQKSLEKTQQLFDSLMQEYFG